MFNIIGKRKIWFIFSGFLFSLSFLVYLIWGLNLGIDFTGGTLMEIEFSQTRPTSQAITDKLSALNLGGLSLQTVGEKGMILRFKEIDEEIHEKIIKLLEENFIAREKSKETKTEELKIETQSENNSSIINPGTIKVETTKDEEIIEKRFESIGPAIGKELKKKSIYAIFAVLIGIVWYVAWAFRKVYRPVSSWKYGVIAVLALFHDVFIVIGVFVFLGRFLGVEVNMPFVAALLTILGYSVNDTIVVFDRIRENLPQSNLSFEETINKSVNQSVSRSISTSLTTILALLAVFFWGSVTIKDFVLALILGIIIGTYSSIFIASPLLVVWEKFNKR